MTVAELVECLRLLPATAQVVVRSPTYASAEEIEENPLSEYFEYDDVYKVDDGAGEAYIYADQRDLAPAVQ